ncbi:16S rRNA (guanine(966)-N(2))-methyltransferase RsmD [Testudinibacter sp. TR-2022]|uniref:16S rRNA (guanine(966)-N(2))-methyltransferase RsmD n=1 Tax=Testudinibacter sp. TR-2022 TaxID=2585029 RepID=UPI001119F37D|nr:16S rRNA (guanine(966)-N(2))-methyltransferase RsmD [Testudinibacter sp. TR-2022]TNH09437.1 16S rRNA (guanine(966)-N(2))-methyltransferase RsmD [Pasteurellaceae bacterium Phil11]TNH20970.1 16S rRNA (guanine(966)-N(2))-methyltransferase RsmD [Testudinibacter sp. TR-2022]TNH28403.1 16S rRNA (guanine(966)-N(2))-methyltransferase RsmD [Testudinibacter sp. TR-2022]
MKKPHRYPQSVQNKASAHSPSKNKGEVRIIAGRWRGRKLPVLSHQGLRPTTDRIKETLFNWLMPYIVGARCLDCFAGSGSLGFEALSRQASAVQFFEQDKSAVKQLQQNLQRLESQRGLITQGDTLQLLAQGNSQLPFDIVFLDPPFQQQLIEPTIERLQNNGWLAAGALVYVETEKQLATLKVPVTWRLLKQKIGGEVCFRLYQTAD